MQNSRIDAPEDRSATCSIRSRNVSSPHWMSSKTTTSGRSAAACSSVLRNAQAISSADVAASVSPSSERIATAAASSARQHVELLQHLDDRPVRDPLAVREAAAADDRRVDGSQSLRGEPRLADAGIADDRDQLAALLGPHALPCLLAGSRARAHGPRTAPRAGAPARRAPAAADRREPGRPCPSTRAVRSARRRLRRERARASARRPAPRPAAPPAPAERPR